MGYPKPFRFDKNRNGVGVLLYLREDLACRELKSDNLPNDIEGIFIELNIRKAKCFLFSIFDPPAQSDDYYFSYVSNRHDAFSSMYDRFSLLAILILKIPKKRCPIFLRSTTTINIVKDKTICKSLNNPSCIDLFIIK